MFRSSAFVLEYDLESRCKQVSALPVEACNILSLSYGHQGLSEVLDDSPLEVPKTLDVVRRLAGQGLIRLARNRRADGASMGIRATEPLAEEVRGWLGIPAKKAREEKVAEEFDDAGFDAAFDDFMSGQDRASETNGPVPLESIAGAMERSVDETLHRCYRLEDLLDAHLEEEFDREVGEILLPAGAEEDLDSFTPLEEEFFDSYVPGDMDGDLEEILDECRQAPTE